MGWQLRCVMFGACVGLFLTTASAVVAAHAAPQVEALYGRAYVGKVTVTSSGGLKPAATGLAVKVRCSGSAAARCTFLFNLVAGVDSGPAASKAVTLRPGTYTISLLLNGSARRAVSNFGVLKAALTVYQQCGSETIVLAQRYPSI